jgi:hypothetical protein
MARMDEKTRRRWFRFGLRTLFVVVAVFAAMFGWVQSQRRWIRDRQEALDWVQQSTRWNVTNTNDRTGLPLGLRLLGERPMERFWVSARWLPEEERYRIEQLRSLFPEARVEVVAP